MLFLWYSYVLIDCYKFQEPVKTKHPQLHYESKLYMLLQGGSKCLFLSPCVPPLPPFCTIKFFKLPIWKTLRDDWQFLTSGHIHVLAGTWELWPILFCFCLQYPQENFVDKFFSFFFFLIGNSHFFFFFFLILMKLEFPTSSGLELSATIMSWLLTFLGRVWKTCLTIAIGGLHWKQFWCSQINW